MSRVNETGKFSALPGATAIPLYSRVKQTAAGVDLAAAVDPTFGSAIRAGYAPDATRDNFQEEMSVKMWNAPGTHFAIANAAITAGAEFEGAASGEIAPLAGGKAIGRAVEAATADGDVIEVVYYPPEAAADELEEFTDPGDAGDIDVTGNAVVNVVTAGAETRTIGDPVAGGQRLVVGLKTDGGNCVITADTAVNQTGNNTLTFADAGDILVLESIELGSGFVWRIVANDGVALSTV